MIICIIPGLSAICQRSRSSSDRGGQKLGWDCRIFLPFFSTFETILTSFLSFPAPRQLPSSVSLCVDRVCASLQASRRLVSCSTSFFPGRSPLWRGDRGGDERGGAGGGQGSRSENGPWVLPSWQQRWSNLPGQDWRFHLLFTPSPRV